MKRRVRNAWLGVLYLLSACSIGCAGGGNQLPADTIPTARKVLSASRTATNEVGAQLQWFGEFAKVACANPLLMPAEWCPQAQAKYDAAKSAHVAIQDGIDGVDSALKLIEFVEAMRQ